MGKQFGRILLPLLISSLILFLNSDSSKSCSGDGGPDDNMYSVFNVRLISQPSLEPFLLSNYLFHPYVDSVFNEEKINLVEWKKYFNNKIDTADIKKLMYPTKFDDVNDIFSKMKSREFTSIDEKWKNNQLVKYWENTRELKSLEYITFAKKCEPLVSENWGWWEPPVRDTTLMLNLIDEGVFEAKKNTEDNFLKLRYAFQAIRLAHYTANYQRAIDLYDNLVAPINTENMVKYWSLSLKAGALKHLGKEAEANYYFAVVFQHCPPKRFTVSLSFKVTSDSLFNKSLLLCKNKEEKTALWAVYAYKHGEVELNAMKHIFLLKPDSPYLELLLAREVSRVETELLPNRDYYWSNYQYFLKDNDYANTNNNIQLTGIVQEIARAGNTIHPYLWDLAAGYLMTLTGETKYADEFLEYAKENWPKNDVIHFNKIRIFKIMNEINALTYITPEDENRILPDLKWLQEKSNESESVKYTGSTEYWFDADPYAREEGEAAFLFARRKLAQLYFNKGDYVKLHMYMGDYRFNYNLDPDPENEPIDAIINFIDKPNKTDYENFLLSIYSQSKDELLSLKGMVYLNGHEFKEAANVYSELSYNTKMSPDPFKVRLNDCHDCDYRESKDSKYTILQFTKRMCELDSLAQMNSDSTAEYYFLLGNGLYNISYFGSCWNYASASRDFDYDAYYREGKNWHFYNCTDAQKNYVKAMYAASDREFAARCCFMAAKCEQNSFYNSMYKMNFREDGDYEKMKFKYRTFFKILKEKYADSDFYNEAIKECRYFNFFVKNDN